MDILCSKVHPVVQVLCPNNDGIFQDDDSPIHTARSVLSWFEEHEYAALQHLLWLAQLSNLNIIEQLWSVLESRVRSRFSPSSLKRLERVVQYSTRDYSELTESIPRRIQAVLQANGGPTPY